jgi:hypothetical protein
VFFLIRRKRKRSSSPFREHPGGSYSLSLTRETQTGSGFVFLSHHRKDFQMAVKRALAIFWDKPLSGKLRKNAFD